MITIKVTVNDQGARQMLQAIADRASDLTPAMRLVGEIVTESVQRNFEQKRSPEGAGWRPLSEQYAQWRSRRHGRNATDILVMNRVLMGGIHYKAEGARVTIAPQSATRAYAAIHQFGGKAGRGRKATIPARPYLGVRKGDWPQIVDVLGKYLISIR
jgi:phage virion morphogenesis protein